MAWDTSRRREGLPGDWPRRRARAIKRAGGRCEYVSERTLLRCKREATDADHRTDRDNHDDLQALCGIHHQRKTQQEAATAYRERYMKGRKRAPEKHPGNPAGHTFEQPTRGVPPWVDQPDRRG